MIKKIVKNKVKNTDHPKLLIKGLSKAFGKKVILDELDLEVRQNES